MMIQRFMGSEGVRVCGVWSLWSVVRVRACGVWSGAGRDCKLRFFKIKTKILNDMGGGSKVVSESITK